MKFTKNLAIKKLFIAIVATVFGALTLGSALPVEAQQSFGPNADRNSNVGLPGAGTDQADNLIGVIQNFINRMLGILGLIALIVLLYGGFQMVTAANDAEKYKTGLTILKNAAIGIAFIGLARFAVSIIFFVVNFVATN